MLALNQTIDSSACTGCGMCVEICPMEIFRLENVNGHQESKLIADRSDSCMLCGHCMAACPQAAVQVRGLSYEEDFFELPKSRIEADQFYNFLESRRSVRVFKDRPVPRDVLEQILGAIASAPMGFTPPKIEISVVSERTVIDKALPEIMGTYEQLLGLWQNPLGRGILRRRTSTETYISLDEHVLPSLRYRLPEMQNGSKDSITRNAPAMLIFHAPYKSGSHTEDAHIALTYGLLAAHALGLGACAIGLVAPAVERSKMLRNLFHIPEENEVLTSFVLGYPKYHFRRGIRRPLAAVHWV